MLSTNQIAGFFNQNKSMKQPHFLHGDTNSQKLKVDSKFFDSALSRIGVANLVPNSKIDFISRMNRCN